MKIEIEIADEDVRGVLERFYGQPNTWCKWAPPVSNDGWYIEVGGHEIKLDIARGLRMMLKRHEPQHRPGSWESPARGIDPGGWNAEQCNAFVQYAAFGEIRYE